MRMSYKLSPFHTFKVLKNHIITLPNVRVQNIKQRNLKETSIDSKPGFRLCPPEESFTQEYSSCITCNRGK